MYQSIIKNQGRRFKKRTTHYTPNWLSKWIHAYTLKELGSPNLVLDPAIGLGALTRPFEETGSQIIGIDTDPSCNLWCDDFSCVSFETLDPWPYEHPDLIVCNPPFNGSDSGMMYPEVFARHLVHLFGSDTPIWMIVPHTFRLTGSRSRRSMWLRSGEFNINMVVALPTDLFDSANVHTELILANAKGHAADWQPTLAPPR